jgi:hypothetical protein
MSVEFVDLITALCTIRSDIEEPKLSTIAERTALDLLLDSLRERNLRVLQSGKTGRVARSR